MSLEIGQLIEGKYRIVRLIGEGGMGAVYEGEFRRSYFSGQGEIVYPDGRKYRIDIYATWGEVMNSGGATGRADQIARQVLSFGKVPEIADLMSRIERLTCDDIRGLAGEVLISTRPAISAVGSLKYLATQERIAAKFG